MSWTPILLVAAATLLGYLVGKLVSAVLTRSLRRHAAATRFRWDDAFVKGLGPGLPVAGATVGLYGSVRVAAPQLPTGFVAATNWIVVGGVVLAAALLVVRVTTSLLEWKARKEHKWEVFAFVGGPILRILVLSLAVLTFLGTVGVSIGPVLASLGIAGLAVALALQDSLENFFAGMWLRATHDIHLGHYIRIEDENMEGTVQEVRWRTTRIRGPSNNLFVVPNATLAKSIITNYNLPGPQTVQKIPITVGRDSDPDHVTKVVLEEVEAAREKVPGILRDPAPNCLMIPGFHDYGLELTLSYHVEDRRSLGASQDAIRRRLWRRFQQEGIRLAYPVQEGIAVADTRRDVAWGKDGRGGGGRAGRESRLRSGQEPGPEADQHDTGIGVQEGGSDAGARPSGGGGGGGGDGKGPSPVPGVRR